MTAAAHPTERLAILALKNEQDVVNSRRCARTIASKLGMDRFDEIRVAIAASDIARLVVKGGLSSSLEFAVQMVPHPAPQKLLLRVSPAPSDSGATFGRLVDGVQRSPGATGEELVLVKTIHGRRFGAG